MSMTVNDKCMTTQHSVIAQRVKSATGLYELFMESYTFTKKIICILNFLVEEYASFKAQTKPALKSPVKSGRSVECSEIGN